MVTTSKRLATVVMEKEGGPGGNVLDCSKDELWVVEKRRCGCNRHFGRVLGSPLLPERD